MSERASDDPRLARFRELYREALKGDFNLEDFLSDTLYAFQILDQAGRSDSMPLRNLAAHLQLELETGIETINIRPLETDDVLNATRKLSTLAGAAPAPAPPAEDKPAAAAPATPLAPAVPGDRRQQPAVTPEMAKMADRLRRFYRAEFGDEFDLQEFITNDAYGRSVLQKSRASSNPELLATVEYFLDDEGRPRRHRRSGPRNPPPAAAA